jgi:hypothetical protein
MTKEVATVKPRKSRKWDPSMLALKRFAKAVDAMPEHHRRANIYWLADRYLGIKLWNTR